MIPKVIHYCWFGGKEKSPEVLRMIASWREKCPDYEIREWNEDNFDINRNVYTRQAYQMKKWAFVSDVARLYALVTEGGIYLDTDVEVLRPFDELLSARAFIGFEGSGHIGTSLIASERGNGFLKDFLDAYNDKVFINKDNTLNESTNVGEITARFEKEGLIKNGQKQVLGDFVLYPTDYFAPYDYIAGKLNTTGKTYSIHWFAKSWIKHSKIRVWLSQLWHRIIGVKMK